MSARLGDRLLARLEPVRAEEVYLRACRRATKARSASVPQHLWAEGEARYRRALRVLARAAAHLASRL